MTELKEHFDVESVTYSFPAVLLYILLQKSVEYFRNMRRLIETDRRLEKLHIIHYTFFHILMNAQTSNCTHTPTLRVSQERRDHKDMTADKEEESLTIMYLYSKITHICDSLLFSVSFKYQNGLPHVSTWGVQVVRYHNFFLGNGNR